MATPVIMPKFGMAQEDGTIIRWFKQEGEAVVKGEAILEVQTDKVDMEVEAPATGILRDIRYGVDDTVPVTTVIASIAAPGEEARIAQAAPPVESGPAEATGPGRPRVSPLAQRMAEAQGVDLEQVQGSGVDGRITRADVARLAPPSPVKLVAAATVSGVRATPAARRLAREGGVPIDQVDGSGPAGRVQAADVRAAASASPDGVAAAHALPANLGTPLHGRRRTIAARLTQSWHEIPHIFLTSSVDMTEAVALQNALAPELEEGGARLTLNTILAFATVAALVRRPRLNAWLRSQNGDLHLLEHAEINLGFAVAIDDGLIVPVVRNAGARRLGDFAQEMAALATRARAAALTPDDVAGGTFTFSNLGMYPVDSFTALINPPQVAILAVGRMQMRPVWDRSNFAPRPVVELTLSADHRALDGAVAAQFLAELKSLLEEPRRLLL